MYKELGSMRVPLILLGTQDAVQTVLRGAINVVIPEVSNEHELDELLQGVTANIFNLKTVILIKHTFHKTEITAHSDKELKEVSIPLLNSNTTFERPPEHNG